MYNSPYNRATCGVEGGNLDIENLKIASDSLNEFAGVTDDQLIIEEIIKAGLEGMSETDFMEPYAINSKYKDWIRLGTLCS